jgi:hypothetical protein
MFIEVAERSVDGSMWLTKCERCGVSLDWVPSLELGMMSVRGLRNLCFGCDIKSGVIASCFRVDGEVADYVIARDGAGLVAVDTRAREAFAVAGFERGRVLRLVYPHIACPAVHISAKPLSADFADAAGEGRKNV